MHNKYNGRMAIDYSIIRTYFEKLGLSSEIADLYIALHIYGPQTISQLARTSKIERTRIYRLQNELVNSNLMEVELQYKRQIFHAAPISNLRILLSKKEQELEQLQTELNSINEALTQDVITSPATRIQFYQGIDGAKQLFWNQTKARSEVLSILHEPMQHKTKKVFFERWVHTINERGIPYRSIVDDNFIDELKTWRRHHKNKTKSWQARRISSDAFTISNATIIYDDIVVYYNWKDGEVFGVEIHNADIANTQRQFFEMLWQQSQPLK